MRFLQIRVFALLFLCANVGKSQDWFIGPEVGINFLQMEKNDLGTDLQLGAHLGLDAAYHFNDYFSLKSGVYVTQKKREYSSNDSVLVNLLGFEDLIGIDGLNLYSFTEINGTVSQVYVELPILAAFTYERISVFAGPYAGYSVSTRRKEITNINTPFLQTVDIAGLGIDPTGGLLAALFPPAESTEFTESSVSNGLRNFDFGLRAGVRYELEDLGINLNYNYGFVDYETTTKKELENHSYLQLTLNYKFGL